MHGFDGKWNAAKCLSNLEKKIQPKEKGPKKTPRVLLSKNGIRYIHWECSKCIELYLCR